MHPQIVKAERVAAFHLPSGYAATLLANIESAGIIEYHYVMVMFGPDENIYLFTASEWSNLDPSYKDNPVFGVFFDDGHANLGSSPDWTDCPLFVLESVAHVRERFGMNDTDLCEAEAWAMTQILKNLQDSTVDLRPEIQNRYLAALSQNDERMVAYMKQCVSDAGFTQMIDSLH